MKYDLKHDFHGKEDHAQEFFYFFFLFFFITSPSYICKFLQEIDDCDVV